MRDEKNVHDKFHFKQKQNKYFLYCKYTPPQKIAPQTFIKLDTINIQLYQNWTPLQHTQEILIIAVKNN